MFLQKLRMGCGKDAPHPWHCLPRTDFSGLILRCIGKHAIINVKKRGNTDENVFESDFGDR